MRISKSETVNLLTSEIESLEKQVEKSRFQYKKMANFSLKEMDGKAAKAIENNIRAQALIVSTHERLFEAISEADESNKSAIVGLPETSPDVLDTDEAQRRCDEAEARIKALQEEQRLKVASAIKHNSNVQSYSASLMLGGPIVGLIDIGLIASFYYYQIARQREIIRANEDIIRKAEGYDRYITNLYSGVDLGIVGEATKSAISCAANDGKWGDFSWVVKLNKATFDNNLERFFTKELEGEAWLEKVDVEVNVGDAAVGRFTAGFGKASFSVEPYGDYTDSNKDGEESTRLGGGVKVKGELSAAVVEGEVDLWGVAHTDTEIKAFTGAAEGEIGCTLFKNGALDPSLRVGGKASASVLEGEVNSRIGSEHNNIHGKAEGALLTAEAEAGIDISKDGVELKGEAGAYWAKGEVSGGLSILGIKIDIGIEGDLGGAGIKAKFKSKSTSAEGELGAGLGLGAGVKFKVDWSGFGAAVDDMKDNVERWWNGLW